MTKQHLYLIHGWGMNKAIWQPITYSLTEYFEIHLLDLPGYGDAHASYPANYSLTNISQQLAEQIEVPGLILGWSLGGLVAQKIAISNPEKLTYLISLASTPCFQAHTKWPGIRPEILQTFQQQLANDYQKTIERFLAIQAMGSTTAKQDIKLIKQLLMQHTSPCKNVLAAGLSILEQADLRLNIADIKTPCTRLYGKLDSLVPAKAIAPIQQLHPQSQYYVFEKASHAPFISHPDEFSQVILSLLHKI